MQDQASVFVQTIDTTTVRPTLAAPPTQPQHVAWPTLAAPPTQPQRVVWLTLVAPPTQPQYVVCSNIPFDLFPCLSLSLWPQEATGYDRLVLKCIYIPVNMHSCIVCLHALICTVLAYYYTKKHSCSVLHVVMFQHSLMYSDSIFTRAQYISMLNMHWVTSHT